MQKRLFLGDFTVKTVCQTGLQGMQASRENGTPPLGGHLPERPVWNAVFTGKSPKSPKSAQNRGYPFWGHFFRKFPPFQGVLAAVGHKKCGNLPRRVIRRGNLPHFWGLPGTWAPEKGGTSQGRVFRGGLHLTPCSTPAKHLKNNTVGVTYVHTVGGHPMYMR